MSRKQGEQRLRRRVGSYLPRGDVLGEQAWQSRHRAILIILWVQVFIVIGYALMHKTSLSLALLQGLAVAAFAGLATMSLPWRRVRSLMATTGLLVATASLVHLAHGLTELHFSYFVLISIVAFYQDWATFVLAIAFVLIEHGVMGVIDSHHLYSHVGKDRNPWFWAAVHAFFISCSSVASLVFWKFAEDAHTAAMRVVEDAAQRESHNQRLESMGRLASGIAHEINSPLQYVGDNLRFTSHSIENLVSLMAAYKKEMPVARWRELEEQFNADYLLEETPLAIKQALEGVERSSTVVRAMNTFSHPGEAVPRSSDLNEALRNDVIVARTQVDPGVEIVMDLGVIPAVTCLLSELNQVFMNLMINASHAIAERGHTDHPQIGVRSRHDNGGVVVSISDTGNGIPADVAPLIFEPFFTTKDVGKGTGQGLALAHSVVTQRHGGRIWFDSVVGQGTTFHIWLPLVAGPVADCPKAHAVASTST